MYRKKPVNKDSKKKEEEEEEEGYWIYHTLILT